jgi:hypothetical protein
MQTSESAAIALVVRLRWGLWYLGSVNAPIVANEFGWSTGGSAAVTDAWPTIRDVQSGKVARPAA